MGRGQKYHCGPEKSPRGVRRVLSFNKRVNQLCMLHDEAYGENSDMTRAQADGIFRSFYKRTGNLFLKLVVRLYYVAVSRFGGKHFKGNKD